MSSCYPRYLRKERRSAWRLARAGHGLLLLSAIAYSDNMIRTQISVDEATYKKAKQIARRKGISLAELCRRSLEEAISREPSDKPWMSFAGVLEGSRDDSSTVDAVVYGREKP